MSESKKIETQLKKHGIEAIEAPMELKKNLFTVKGYFHGDMVGLYMYDADEDRAARFTWHGVNIGSYAYSPATDKMIAVCVHPPKTQKNDERATVMGYDIGRIHSDLRYQSREKVERTTDTGVYGFIVVRPGYLFRSLEYRDDGIYFTAEEDGSIRKSYYLRSPGEMPEEL